MLVQEERARLVLKGRPTSLAASLSSSGPVLIYAQDIPIRALYGGQRSARRRAAAQAAARFWQQSRISIELHTVIESHFTKGGPGCCNLHSTVPSPSGSPYYASGSSRMSPRSILSTTTHIFHGNMSPYAIVRRAAPLTAPAGIRRLGSPPNLSIDSQSLECFRKAIPCSNICRQERTIVWPAGSHDSVLAVLLHIPADHHRKAVTLLPGLDSYWT